MRTRTAAALTLLLAAGTLGTLTGTAAAAPPEGVGPYVAYRAWAAYADADSGLFAEVTVEEVRDSGTSVGLVLSGEGWSCTVDAGDPTVADVEQLDAARVVGSFDYTCTEDDAPQGLAPQTVRGTVAVDLTWTGSGRPERLPLYHCNVGRSLVRQATVTGTVSLAGGLVSDLGPVGSGMSHDHVVCPPGRPA